MDSTQNKNLLEHKHKNKYLPNQVFIRDKNIFNS